MSTLFKTLAELGEKLEATRKRTAMIDRSSAFLKSVNPEEIEPAVNMLLGRPFPKWDQRTLEVSWATLSEIIRRTTAVDWKVFAKAFSNTGDIGAATKTVFEKSNAKRQTALFEKTLTIGEVRRSFEM